MGGRRGYGPTHSQSLEKFGIYGLNVYAQTQFSYSKYYNDAIKNSVKPNIEINTV